METLNEKEIKMNASVGEFLRMQSVGDLARIICIPLREILLSAENSDASYQSFMILKKTNGYRQIEAPRDSLKTIQTRINFFLNIIYSRIKPESVHGFVKNVSEKTEARSIVTNAHVHVRKKFVLNMDVKDFFHSVDIWRVKHLFMSYPFYFSNDLSAFLALLTTYKERLPMGAPTSPVISNLACFLFDRRIIRFTQEHELSFTRYADDLTFSSNQKITASLVEAIKKIVEEYGFIANESKTRLLTHNGAQVVTGLKVNEKVNVSRKFVRNVRAMLNNWATHGLTRASRLNKSEFEFLNMLKGKINFLGMVKGKKDSIYLKMLDRFSSLEAQYFC